MKIVIVGGGTAGWIATALFFKYTKGYDVTVVESSKHPIIGVGEGSADSLRWLINQPWPDNVINEMDFLKKTKGTIKLAINLVNWRGDGSRMYSPLFTTPSNRNPVDIVLLASILKYGRSDMGSMNSWIMKDNLATYDKKYKPPVLPYSGLDLCGHAYHFDSYEVGKYFKNVCLAQGYKCIDAEVVDTEFDENEYLKNVTLSDGQKLEADLFLDCTGFNRVLMGKTKNKWISYKDNLPVNSAIPFSLPISSKTVKFETLAETMNTGWLWKIPLQHKNGCGYVTCDAFQTFEQSVSEIEKKLKQPIDASRNIKFDCGRYEKLWYKNIVAVGLSSHFLEPLQATSIHIAIHSSTNLVLHNLKSVESIRNEANVKRYNDRLGMVIDDYKDMLQLHYLSGRNDTDFWKWCRNEMKITDRNKEYIEISKHRLLNQYDVNEAYGIGGWNVWSHIFDNAGLFKKELIEAELDNFQRFREYGAEDLKALTNLYETKVKPMLATAEDFFKYLKV
jgi:tryptophan halogenase